MISDGDLEREFGLPFLAYVCAYDEAMIRERLHTGKPLDQPREAALDRLRALAEIPTPIPSGWGPTRWRVKEALREIKAGETEFQQLRRACGGSIDIPNSKDSLTNTLLRIALDVYPLLLVPRGELAFPMSWDLPTQLHLPEAAHEHCDAAAFEAATMADVDLRRLFPKDDAVNGRCGTFVSSTGGSRDIFLKFFSSAIVELAWWERRLDLAGIPTPEQLLAHVPTVIANVQALARGESVRVAARVGFNGIALHRWTHIETSVGTLRAETEGDAWYIPGPAKPPALETGAIPSGLPSAPSFLEAFGEAPFFLDPNTANDFAAPAVLVGTLDVTLQVLSNKPTSSPETNCQALLAYTAETIQLGILTAVCDQPQPLLVAPTWWAIIEPFKGVQVQWSELFTARLLSHMPRAITLPYYPPVQEAIERVAVRRTPSIDVAIRRLVSAHIDRYAPADKLIDIVIAWENLFGPRSQKEITRTVSTALGNLLSSASSQRGDRIRKDAVRIYGLRSRLVHGGSAKVGQVEAAVPRAFDLTRQAFCELLERRPELVADPNRGERLRGPTPRWPSLGSLWRVLSRLLGW